MKFTIRIVATSGQSNQNLTVLITAFFLTVPVMAQQNSANQNLANIAANIDTIIDPHIDADLLSGEILIARGNQILFDQTFGFASWELRIPNTQATRFGIASITKPLTETLVGVLVRAGRLEFDAPVEKYIPNFPKGPNGGAPTIQELVSHRGGVPHRVTKPIEETQVLLASDIVSRIRKTGLLFEPGTQRTYSSAGYTSLARAIELIENKPFAKVLEEYVLVPAGMTSAVSETGQRLMARRALPYRLGAHDGKVIVKSAPYKDLRFLTGAGSVFATGQDLMNYVRAIKNGVFGDKAWQLFFGDDPASWQSFSGRTNGYEASVDVHAKNDLVFVFLTNLQSASNWQVRAQIQALLQGADAASIPLPPPVGDRFEDPTSILGTYGRAEINLVDNKLYRGDNEFYAVDGGSYYIPASGTTMRFRRDTAGLVDALISISAGGRETVLPKSEIR